MTLFYTYSYYNGQVYNTRRTRQGKPMANVSLKGSPTREAPKNRHKAMNSVLALDIGRLSVGAVVHSKIEAQQQWLCNSNRDNW